jgi:hypothetical protein
MSWKIFDALNNAGASNILAWIAKKKITKHDIVRLNQRMDLLTASGLELAPGIFAGPVKSKKNKKLVSHIYKIIIKGDRMLRPMFCKGPIDMDNEFTMLLGAIEVGDVLDTDSADAEKERQAIIKDPKRWRKTHERYS